MKFDYQETTKDLLSRIDIHDRFGSKDIDEWMLDLLQPRKGSRILDVGCGSGKQCLVFANNLEGDAKIVGGDVSMELLAQARMMADEQGLDVDYRELDFNREFDWEDAEFDLVTCCFAIYYASNIPFTISEMHRVLKPGGRLFTTGPLPDNKQLFYDIIAEAMDRSLPPMPGSSRYDSEILGAIKSIFRTVDEHRFENPLRFSEPDPFIEYTRASLSEDRKLWSNFFDEEEGFNDVMERITDVANRRWKEEGDLEMKKVVGGFVAHK